jgi:ribosomal protein S18 acetylase RimI-like enzyme
MWRVVTAEPAERTRVLSFMFASLPQEESAARLADVLRAEADGSLSLDGLLKVEHAGRLIAAGFYMVQADRTAYLWPPVTGASPVADDACDALLQEICHRIDRADALLAQCLLAGNETAERRALLRNGFEHLADLSFLQRPLDKPLPPRVALELETVTFDAERNRDQFALILERTYCGTLDCPAFNDHRTGHDALRSHQTSGRFDPRRWKLYRRAGADVGVLLMSDHPEQDAWEVVYIGIVPEARGENYGRALVLEGLHAARSAHRSSVFLAVDLQNAPALRVYRGLGFDEIALRAVYVRWPARDS